MFVFICVFSFVSIGLAELLLFYFSLFGSVHVYVLSVFCLFSFAFTILPDLN